MTIIDTYPKVFDNVIPLSCTSENPNMWMVCEKNPQAKISLLKIYYHTNKHLCFDEQITKDMPDITTVRTTHILDDECDGLGIFISKEKELLVFVDLKSNFDTKKIQHAFIQSLCSFMKLHSMLSLCDCYDITKNEIEFIVTSCCFPNENKETEVYDWLLREKTAHPDSFATRIVYPLLKHGSICIQIKDFPIIENVPFNNDLLHKKVRLTLVRSKNYNDSCIEYTLNV